MKFYGFVGFSFRQTLRTDWKHKQHDIICIELIGLTSRPHIIVVYSVETTVITSIDLIFNLRDIPSNWSTADRMDDGIHENVIRFVLICLQPLFNHSVTGITLRLTIWHKVLSYSMLVPAVTTETKIHNENIKAIHNKENNPRIWKLLRNIGNENIHDNNTHLYKTDIVER